MPSTLRIIVLLVTCVILPHQVSKAGTLSLSGYNHQGVTGWFDGTLTTQYGGRITATFDGPSGIFVGSSVGENAAFPRRQGGCSTRSSTSRFLA